MTLEECKALIERFHTSTNQGDVDAFDDIFAPDFVNEAAGFDPVNGCDDMKALIRELLDAFPDWHVVIEDMFGEGNKIVVRWRMTATHRGAYRDIPPTHRQVNAEGIHIDHIEDGRIARRWACNNFSELFASLRAPS